MATPYEKRYQAVHSSGGTRFYPNKPSQNFENFLKERKGDPGLAVVAGCGEGRNLSPLLDRGWHVVGVDSAASALAVSGREYVGKDRLQLIKADVLGGLPVADHTADLVVAIEFLHLLTDKGDREKFYRNIHRMLRSGGAVFFENNGRLNADETTLLEGGKVEPRTVQTKDGPIQIPLVRLPTIMMNGRTLREELEAAGFVGISMRSDSFHHPDTVREQIVAIAYK